MMSSRWDSSLSVADAASQWNEIVRREPPSDHPRQVDYLPVETVVVAAASLVVNRRRYGGANISSVPSPLPELATLLGRSTSSLLYKLGNLDGSRPNGAARDREVGALLQDEPRRFARLLADVFAGARSAGIGTDQLPDFLPPTFWEDRTLLARGSLGGSPVESMLAQVLDDAVGSTERAALASMRVGQMHFARGVVANCHGRCVFCGLTTPAGGPQMLVASHIKPWRDSDDKERLDVRNGIAACPTHDRAFDVGYISLDEDFRALVSPELKGIDPPTPLGRIVAELDAFPGLGSPGLMLRPPLARYVAHHREHVFRG